VALLVFPPSFLLYNDQRGSRFAPSRERHRCPQQPTESANISHRSRKPAPFGNRDEVAEYRLSSSIQVHWLEDGNHDFTPRKASGRTQQQNWQEAIDAIAGFVEGL